MGKAAADEMWVLCPNCLVRGLVPRSAEGAQIRCRQCATIFVAEPEQASREELLEDDLKLAPLDLPPPSGVATSWQAPDDYGVEPEAARHPMAGKLPPVPPAPPEKPPDYVVLPPKEAGLVWAFTSNVLLFPWHLSALLQWIFASGGLIVAVGMSLLAFDALANSPMEVALAILLAAVACNIVSLLYLTPCLFDITTNAAYNCDKLQEWPHGAWSERIVYLFRTACLTSLAAIPATGIAEVSVLTFGYFWPVFFPIVFFLFPILMLATLEADTYFWPVSPPIYRSLRVEWRGWLAFYLLAGLLLGGGWWISIVLADKMALRVSLAIGPIWAAVVFIYGRMLGRLTWLILRHADLGEKKVKIKTDDMPDLLMRGVQ